MNGREKAIKLKQYLDKVYGHVDTFLKYDKNKPWQLLFAIMLSAQSTDNKVNSITPILFEKYPSLEDMAKADPLEVEEIIRPIGLAHTKAAHLVESAKELVLDYGGFLPNTRKGLMELPGVGYKTAGVFLGEMYDEPYIPVDTHVYRVAQVMGLVRWDLPTAKVEEKLEKLFDGLGNKMNTHRQLIKFGRDYLHPGVEGHTAWKHIDEVLSGKEK